MEKKRVNVLIHYPDRAVETAIWVNKGAGMEEIEAAVKEAALSMIVYEWHVAE